MVEIRVPGEEDREQVFDTMQIALNLGLAWREHRSSFLEMERFLCAVDAGRVIAVAAERPFTQHFGGRDLPMTGVYAVATLPEHRGRGLAAELVAHLVRRGRERGDFISTLYPAALRPYRSLGFELAGSYVDQAVALDDLPVGPGARPVEEYRPGEDLAGVRRCFREAIAGHNGPVDYDDLWWERRTLSFWMPDVRWRTVVVRGTAGIEGYASFHYEPAEGELSGSFDIACTHLVARTADGLSSLLAYFRSFRGLGQRLTWHGPPADPIALLVGAPRVRQVWSYRWMSRLLDVPAALQGRGYVPVDGECAFAIEDALFPENAGPWLLRSRGGEVAVEPHGGEATNAISVGTLSSLFTGFITPSDAARIGTLDPALVPFLSSLLAGPAPWMPDFF